MNKKIQFSIMLILALIIGVLIYYFNPAPNSYEFHKQFYKKDYYGIVSDVFIDTKNHQDKTIICFDLNDRDKTFRVHTPDGNNRIFEIVNYGDTIIKKSNSKEIIVIGKEGHTYLSYNLKYPNSP